MSSSLGAYGYLYPETACLWFYIVQIMEIIIVIYYIMEVKSFQIVPRMNAFQTNIEDVCRGGRFPKFTWRLDACI